PLSTPAEPWTIGPPFAVISFWRAAGFPLIHYSFCYLPLSCLIFIYRIDLKVPLHQTTTFL
ncbi:hypothetical protein COQ80_22985, partial [Salmonella enterica]|nr:hypothetical protein [Salmonella enterica]